MHEHSLARRIVRQVERLAGEKAPAVRRVTLLVQPSMVTPDSLRHGFDEVKQESSLSRAVLEIKEAGLFFYCKDCGQRFSGEKMAPACPYCRSQALRLDRYGEVWIDSVALENGETLAPKRVE